VRLATASTGAMGRAASVAAVLAAMLLEALVLAGCGSSSDHTLAASRIRGRTLTVYASAPLLGRSSVAGEAVVSGARLALDQVGARIGEYHIAFKALNDATAARGGWDPGQTTINARTAVLDPTTIGYLGEVDSGASAISIPPLNRAGIPQVSPTSAAVGLTSAVLGAFPGEPQKYYPTGIRTFARVVPDDRIQAIAQVHVQQGMGCASTFVLNDGEVDGADAARSFVVAAQAAHLPLAGVATFVRDATSYKSFAAGVAKVAPDCVLIAADTESGAVPLTTQLAAAMPDVKIFGTADLAESTYCDPKKGGIPLSVDPRVVLTSPALGLSDYPPSARAFNATYKRRYGPPEPAAIYGYEAMSLLLSAIDRATGHGTRAAVRSQVRAAIFATHDRRSVLGTYSIARDGDTTLRRYGVWNIVDGGLTFWETIDA
jgi:branched-chain amino acid transport system substrate-binding protein